MICLIFIKNIKKYNTNKKHRILIVFDEMIADILSNKKLIRGLLEVESLIFLLFLSQI